jgi:hypothetical protein
VKPSFVIGLAIVAFSGALMGLGVGYEHAETCTGSLSYVLDHCFTGIRQFTFTIGILVGIPGWAILKNGQAILGPLAVGFGLGYAAGGHRFSALAGGVIALFGAWVTVRVVSATNAAAS